jgi:hypothetical protein
MLKLLKRFLEQEEQEKVNIEDIKPSQYDENTFDTPYGEYMVLTEDKANEKAKEYILDSLWAFNSSFIIQHSKVLDYDKGSEQIIKAIQEQCENGNEAMKKLIDNLDEFVEEAIEADGRGHFLNTYDGQEHEIYNEETKEYMYIYKMS